MPMTPIPLCMQQAVAVGRRGSDPSANVAAELA